MPCGLYDSVRTPLVRFVQIGLLLATPEVIGGVGGAAAQVLSPDSALQPHASAIAPMACAPFLTYTGPTSALHLIASQDPTNRLLLAQGQTLVIDAGSAAGLETGQEYFVRRLSKRFGARGPDKNHPVSVHTLGWIKVLTTAETLSTAQAVFACDGMLPGDYLEPFVAPASLDDPAPAGQVQYSNLAEVLRGDEDRDIAGAGEFTTIDRGSDHGVQVGQRFVVLRDKKGGAPLVEIGEGLVTLVQPQTATVRITRSRDAIQAGDFVAFKK